MPTQMKLQRLVMKTFLVLLTDFNFHQVSEEGLKELRECFMEAYDDNDDGKIDIREVWL